MASSLFKRSLAMLSAAGLAAVLIFALVGSLILSRAYADANSRALVRAAEALAAVFPTQGPESEGVAGAFARASASSGYRVTLIARDGKVLADSEADPKTMENHASRPEVAAALAGRSASSRRTSTTIGEELVYAAAPMPGGALRLALHLPTLNRALSPSRWAFAAAAAAIALAALAAAAAFSRMTAGPLASLAKAAGDYGSGGAAPADSYTRAIGRSAPEEMRVLSATLDAMAAEIGKRVGEAEAQGGELEAILDAMAEAVLALDSRLAITLANPAADALFALDGAIEGRGLLEATRSSDLQEVAADCLASGERRAVEISLYLPAERFFRALAAPLRRAGDSVAAGVVLVLGDITELRRLERVRRDFVANVSHELRTPVQLVKGFTEVLGAEILGPGSVGDGAAADPEKAARFLGIIARNADRMESLISDLLSLASLEREGREWLAAESSSIVPILEAAREAILPKAQARETELRIEADAGIAAKVDAGLLEQAVINLIDNAVKYSPRNTVVRILARSESGFLIIEVKDQGIGIPARDLPRLFERFYRVDRARSRELGGTGLGLAIVKHIALAHGGGVAVESYEGEGSTFKIKVPLE